MRNYKRILSIFVIVLIFPTLVFAQIEDFKSFSEIKKYYYDKNIFISSDIECLNFEAVQEVSLAINDVLEYYPQIEGTLQSIWADDMENTIMGVTASGNIILSDYYFKTYERIAKYSDWRDGFHPKNTGVKSHGYHEMGHIVELYILQNDNVENNYDDWIKFTTAKQIVSDAIESVKQYSDYKNKNSREITRKISYYATYNPSEAIAEAVSDYFTNGQYSNLLSLAIIEQLEIKMCDIEKTKNET